MLLGFILSIELIFYYVLNMLLVRFRVNPNPNPDYLFYIVFFIIISVIMYAILYYCKKQQWNLRFSLPFNLLTRSSILYTHHYYCRFIFTFMLKLSII